MMIKEKLRKLKRKYLLYIQFSKEMVYYYRKLVKYNASISTEKDIEKMQYALLRLNHTLEKGMSLPNPKKGFGQKKVLLLIQGLNKYIDLYGNREPDFILYPLSSINGYIKYTKESGVQIDEIENEYNKLKKKSCVDHEIPEVGIHIEMKQNIQFCARQDFESLLSSRHAIRSFSRKDVDKHVIYDALNLAKMTPSACNRQAWKTHVFCGSQSIELIKWQDGSHGFEDEIRCSILITANLKGFLSHEIHQVYIDGGLYAMNLINSLHYLGLGTIPLSCGFEYQKLVKLQKFGIPDNEVPILIIGTGYLPDSFKVATSERKNVEYTNIFH